MIIVMSVMLVMSDVEGDERDATKGNDNGDECSADDNSDE